MQEEHRKDLVREKEQVDFEHKRADEWVHDLRESFNWEIKQLEELVSKMERALECPRGESDGGVASKSGTYAPPTTAESVSTGEETCTVASTGGGDGPPPGDSSTTGTTHTDPATETQLLQAQTEAMTAQAQAAAMQHLPVFNCSTS